MKIPSTSFGGGRRPCYNKDKEELDRRTNDDEDHDRENDYHSMQQQMMSVTSLSSSMSSKKLTTKATAADHHHPNNITKYYNYKYRGFTTSITDHFNDPEMERVDCCSVCVCCGILQVDRNRYATTKKLPPSFCKRICLHLIFPCWIFMIATICAMNITNQLLNQLLCTGMIVCLFAYIILQYSKGVWKKRYIRQDLLLWSKNKLITTTKRFHNNIRRNYDYYDYNYYEYEEEDEDEDNSQDDDTAEDEEMMLQLMMGQTRSDINNAHSLLCFGCYTSDFDHEEEEEEEGTRNNNNNNQSICSQFFQCFATLCCCCGIYLQVCGLCGIAQESREIEKLSGLPPDYKYIDYITMQPIMEYYPAIYLHRHEEDETAAVGRRSSNRGSGSTTFFWHRLSQLSKMILMIFAGIIALMVACACLFSLIRWKYFFLFVCANVILSGLFVVMLGYCWNHPVYGILSADALIKYFASGFFLSASLAMFWEFLVIFIFRLTIKLLFDMDTSTEEENGYQQYYYSLAMTSTEASSNNNDGGYSLSPEANIFWIYYSKEHMILSTIFVLIKSFCVTAIIEELCKYFGYRMIDHPDFYNRQKLEQATSGSTLSVGGKKRKLSFSKQDSATLMAKSSAITFAMIATALGFACCQNIAYYIVIVIRHSAAVSSTVFVVATRSILVLFVHSIAAAIQSTGVCKRDIEKDDTIQVGRIILPSIIFLGSYDFLMTWIDATNSSHDVKYQTKFLLSTFLTFSIGLCFYLWRASLQQQRLESLDPTNNGRSPIIDFWNKDTEGEKQYKRRWSWFRKKKNQSVR